MVSFAEFTELFIHSPELKNELGIWASEKRGSKAAKFVIDMLTMKPQIMEDEALQQLMLDQVSQKISKEIRALDQSGDWKLQYEDIPATFKLNTGDAVCNQDSVAECVGTAVDNVGGEDCESG